MGLVKCPDCHCTISDDMEFCPACGKRMKAKTIYPGRPTMKAMPSYCSWCGTTVPAGMKNCPGCGSPARLSYRPDGDAPSSGKSSGGLGKRTDTKKKGGLFGRRR